MVFVISIEAANTDSQVNLWFNLGLWVCFSVVVGYCYDVEYVYAVVG